MTPQLAGLEEFVRTLARPGEPGLAVGVYADGGLVASAAAGCAVPEHAVPVTERTAFDIASVSKHMTAACLLLLARDGLVRLDDDIRAVLPELALRHPVSLRQCLTHTGGLRDYFALCDIAGLPVAGMTQEAFWDLVTGQADLDFAPGSSFCYSNTGYVLAAVIAGRVSGQSLARYAAERLFGPLGMTATHFRDDVSILVPGLAAGYLTGPAGAGFRRCDVTENIVGDGAVVTSIADLAGWHSFLATGAGLGTDIRDGLATRQRLADGTVLGYGLGLEAVGVDGEHAWWHSGSWAGYRAAILWLPARGAGVSVLANRDDRYPSHVAQAVACALVSGGDPAARYLELAGTPAPVEDARREAEATAGLWHDPDQDVFVDFGSSDGFLTRTEHGGEHRIVLGADGRWHGSGALASTVYARDGDTLHAVWGLSARPEASYRRADPVTLAQPPAPVPSGHFFNEELGVHADLWPDGAMAGRIRVGLAPERTLSPAGPGLWRSAGARAGEGSAVTVREAGADLLISVAGARRVRFTPVTRSPCSCAVPRGLAGRR